MSSMTKIDGLLINPQKIIDTLGGDVMHVLKNMDDSFVGFGEAYFSVVEFGVIKAWKRHHEMVMNLVVPVGEISLVFFDDREDSSSFRMFQEITLSRKNYARITVPPLLWVGFKGIGIGVNMLLNIASIPHNPDEVDTKKINEIKFDWGLK